MPTRTVKLGATAPALETIRDFLHSDVNAIKREVGRLQYDLERITIQVKRLSEVIEGMETVALDLLDTTITANSNTEFEIDQPNDKE